MVYGRAYEWVWRVFEAELGRRAVGDAYGYLRRGLWEGPVGGACGRGLWVSVSSHSPQATILACHRPLYRPATGILPQEPPHRHPPTGHPQVTLPHKLSHRFLHRRHLKGPLQRAPTDPLPIDSLIVPSHSLPHSLPPLPSTGSPQALYRPLRRLPHKPLHKPPYRTLHRTPTDSSTYTASLTVHATTLPADILQTHASTFT